jgi:hypothetical protein
VRLPAGRSANFSTSANWNGKGSLFFEKSQCNRQR